MQTLPDQQLIALRAYEIWESEGRPEGRHREHWSQAEHELAEGSSQERVAGEDTAAPPAAPNPPMTPI